MGRAEFYLIRQSIFAMLDEKRLSKRLSYVLRHHPEAVGISLDRQGWISVDVLLAALAAHGTAVTRVDLEQVVRNNSKQRFAISDDGQRIRANQGHSIKIDLGYATTPPPSVLYHGTTERNLESIRAKGLEKRARHHVHLSATFEAAHQVGNRHGRPLVLSIDAAHMHTDGYVFHVTPNGVWLVDAVPARYLRFPVPRATNCEAMG
jgi:putative RNA 2'-phosphotransferase